MRSRGHSHTFPKTAVRGFTLLEVLVASAILVVMMILLIGVADHTTQQWHRGEQHRNTSGELRAGLEMITEDLHSAVLTTNPTTLVISRERAGDCGSRLFFLVSHPGEQRAAGDEGDLCATGYFIAEDPKIKGSANLYRFHASGSVVAKAFAQNKLQSLYDSAGVINATTELLARNLVKLDVRRVGESPASGGLLMISLSTPRDNRSGKNASPLREDQLLRYSTIIRLPPQRELSPGL